MVFSIVLPHSFISLLAFDFIYSFYDVYFIDFVIERPAEYGGNTSYINYQSLEEAFANKVNFLCVAFIKLAILLYSYFDFTSCR